MPLFEITKSIAAVLTIECESENEAANWADKIVVDIQDENAAQIQSKEIISFEAEAEMSKTEIKKL